MPKKSVISRSGRFTRGPTAEVAAYTQSVSFDWKFYRADIRGSIAHATMLAKQRLISQGEKKQIIRGLQQIENEIAKGQFKWDSKLEDVHMNIEQALTRRVPAAAKLHTGRSRNDQVATDTRIWVREECLEVQKDIRLLQKALVRLAGKTRLNSKDQKKGLPSFLPIPGYTHLQRAQPVLAAHHLLAYVEMLDRDWTRFRDAAIRLNVCPLGSGAIASSSLPLDRASTARALGFEGWTRNSMDAVSDRDYMAEFLFASALTGIHLSRMAEDFILWSSAEFGFVSMGDTHTTGSSLMPQKKNPDVAELGRGKSGRLVGNLMGLLTLLKGLPMTYNRDLQEDKPFLLDTSENLRATLRVFSSMLDETHFVPANCIRAVSDPALLATELADELVRKGVPFRNAHHAVGEAVQLAEKTSRTLRELTQREWQKIHPKFGNGVQKALSLENYFRSRDRIPGAPGVRQVQSEWSRWSNRLS